VSSAWCPQSARGICCPLPRPIIRRTAARALGGCVRGWVRSRWGRGAGDTGRARRDAVRGGPSGGATGGATGAGAGPKEPFICPPEYGGGYFQICKHIFRYTHMIRREWTWFKISEPGPGPNCTGRGPWGRLLRTAAPHWIPTGRRPGTQAPTFPLAPSIHRKEGGLEMACIDRHLVDVKHVDIYLATDIKRRRTGVSTRRTEALLIHFCHNNCRLALANF